MRRTSSLLVALRALGLQRAELRLQRDEMKLQREEMKRQRSEMKESRQEMVLQRAQLERSAAAQEELTVAQREATAVQKEATSARFAGMRLQALTSVLGHRSDIENKVFEMARRSLTVWIKDAVSDEEEARIGLPPEDGQ